ncbi:ATP-binding cassette domain-containing protein [Roseobacter sp. HKCCA0434]|uniref:ATP-binding cassette domain-containing protein n=1 Tax=Roseobacter sp. HKCCA0434 TaxID=3079297 RepID=UPI002905CAF6|nr:ATP-binding cassette domain-containing protein [Roseobacter sp. HKCCA0434]
MAEPVRQIHSGVVLPPPVRLDGVGLRAGSRTLLSGIDASFGLSPVTVILGPNGAGKTQLLRLVAGLARPDSGTIRYAWPPRPEKHRTALVFQRPVLLRRSAIGNLTHALAQYGVPRRDRRARAQELLRFADLEHRATAPARALSGGEQQRLALARALGAAPDMLLLDEPTAHLDPRATAGVEALVARVVADGVRVVLITHDIGQARRLASEIVFLHAGRLTEQTPANRFFARPASAEARAYLQGDLLL